MLNKINFEIKGIYAGWFDVVFKTESEEIGVTASNAWENDSPRLFLHMLFEIYEKQDCDKYVIWDEEPGVYIIFMSKKENTYEMNIAFSEFCHDELFADIRNVTGDISYDEMCSKLKDLKLLCKFTNIDYLYLIRTIIRAFEENQKGKEYQENWMEFPCEELDKLKNLE